MSHVQQRIPAKSANARPALDFVQPRKRSGLRLPLTVVAVLMAGGLAFQELHRETGAVAPEGKIDMSLAASVGSVMPVGEAAMEEIDSSRLPAAIRDSDVAHDALQRLTPPDAPKAQRKPQPKPSLRVAALPVAAVNVSIMPLPEMPAADAHVGAALQSEMTATGGAWQQQVRQPVAVPEIVFTQHVRLTDMVLDTAPGDR